MLHNIRYLFLMLETGGEDAFDSLLIIYFMLRDDRDSIFWWYRLSELMTKAHERSVWESVVCGFEALRYTYQS